MCQGKVNPFKTSEAVDSITQTTTTHSGKSDSEMMAEMLRLKAMFEQRGRKKKQRVVSSYKAPYSSVYSYKPPPGSNLVYVKSEPEPEFYTEPWEEPEYEPWPETPVTPNTSKVKRIKRWMTPRRP